MIPASQKAKLEEMAEKHWLAADNDMMSAYHEHIFMAGAQAAWDLREAEVIHWKEGYDRLAADGRIQIAKRLNAELDLEKRVAEAVKYERERIAEKIKQIGNYWESKKNYSHSGAAEYLYGLLDPENPTPDEHHLVVTPPQERDPLEVIRETQELNAKLRAMGVLYEPNKTPPQSDEGSHE